MEEKIIDLLLKLDQGELNIAQTAREIQELNNFNHTDIFHQDRLHVLLPSRSNKSNGIQIL